MSHLISLPLCVSSFWCCLDEIFTSSRKGKKQLPFTLHLFSSLHLTGQLNLFILLCLFEFVHIILYIWECSMFFYLSKGFHVILSLSFFLSLSLSIYIYIYIYIWRCSRHSVCEHSRWSLCLWMYHTFLYLKAITLISVSEDFHVDLYQKVFTYDDIW